MEHQLHSDIARLTLINGGQPHVEQDIASADNAEKVRQRLPALLQTTLILNDILSLFRSEISRVLPFNSFHYLNTAINCHLDIEIASHHRCHYKLEINGHYLGDITLTRRYKFTDRDVELFEELLCLLIYPLRNALLYKHALSSAMRDELTGLGNRMAYESSLSREIELAKRQLQPLSLIIIDIDDFKQVNDTFGHSCGDKALKAVAETITISLRAGDIAFRFGGEEFVLLLNNTSAVAAGIVAERIRLAVADLNCKDDRQPFNFTISLGIAELEADEQSYHLFERADMALYQAKQAGRNTSVYANSRLL